MEEKKVVIAPPNIQIAAFKIRGTAPLVMHRFYKKAEIMAKMQEGNASKSKKTRTARDYEEESVKALHVMEDGKTVGFPASAFRAAMVRACSIVGYKMTLAKLAVFVVADGIDSEDGCPLVKIDGKWETATHATRNETGVVDIRARPMFREWSATVKIQFDADMFTFSDIANLLSRVGLQVGIGEGRPGSKNSSGMGWGTFELVN